VTLPPLGLSRRRFVQASALGIAGAGLPGCVTTPRSPAVSAPGCLARVEVSEDRIIRHAVGLRPYRASGFVVRQERLGEKRLVHNYGHGGAGITLSWGTSKLATDLGLQGHRGPVAVIGSGGVGLATARLVQEAGFPVRIYTAALPPDTTSNVAGGQWGPFGHYRDDAVTDEWWAQFMAALDYSWRRFQIMVGEEYGVRWLTTYVAGSRGPDPSNPLERYYPDGRNLSRAEHPFALDGISSYRTMYVETGRFLRQLLRDVRSAGGSVELRRFATSAEIAALPETLVFNCTGLGARALFGDEELRPARGQLVILRPQPEIDYAFTGRPGYMFPRPDGIILGGTFDLDNWSTAPGPAAAERILRSHQRLFGSLRCS